jgi:hypothetical protein
MKSFCIQLFWHNYFSLKPLYFGNGTWFENCFSASSNRLRKVYKHQTSCVIEQCFSTDGSQPCNVTWKILNGSQQINKRIQRTLLSSTETKLDNKNIFLLYDLKKYSILFCLKDSRSREEGRHWLQEAAFAILCPKVIRHGKNGSRSSLGWETLVKKRIIDFWLCYVMLC